MTKHNLSDGTYAALTRERFLRKVDRTGGPRACWLWLGGVQSSGYGCFGTKRPGEKVKHHLAHRFAFEHLGADALDPDLTIDHLCSNKLCVNPDHMEQVTREENSRRGRLSA